VFLKKEFRILYLILFLTAIFLLFYFSLFDKKDFQSRTMIGKEIPNLKAQSLLKNEIVSLKNIVNDEVFIVNIFASWCAPCKIEHPFLVKLNQDKIKIIGINYKDNRKNAKKFLKNYKNPYHEILIDSDGELSINLGAFGVPETFLVDKNFIIIDKKIGPIDDQFVKKASNFK